MSATNLPLMTQALDTATPVRQANQDQQTNAMNHEQILKAYYDNMDNRERSRLSSVIAGAMQLEPFLQNQDYDGAHEFLMRRRQSLVGRMGAGDNIDTEDTDAAIQMLRTGNVEELTQTIQGLKAAGRVYGILDNENAPSNVREWQYFNSLSPEQREQYLTMKRANPVINTGDAQVIPSQVNPAGSPQAKFDINPSPESMPDFKYDQTMAVQTAEHDSKKMANRSKAELALNGLEAQAGLMTDTIDKAIATVSPYSTGYGALLSKLPNSDARKLENYLNTIKANVGFDKLQAMREASPTGGALGAVSDSENRLLQAVNGALDPMQADQLVENLNVIKEMYPRVLAEQRQKYNSDYGNVQTPSYGQQGGSKITVRNPQTGETFRIDEADLAEAQAEGFVVQ